MKDNHNLKDELEKQRAMLKKLKATVSSGAPEYNPDDDIQFARLGHLKEILGQNHEGNFAYVHCPHCGSDFEMQLPNYVEGAEHGFDGNYESFIRDLGCRCPFCLPFVTYDLADLVDGIESSLPLAFHNERSEAENSLIKWVKAYRDRTGNKFDPRSAKDMKRVFGHTKWFALGDRIHDPLSGGMDIPPGIQVKDISEGALLINVRRLLLFFDKPGEYSDEREHEIFKLVMKRIKEAFEVAE